MSTLIATVGGRVHALDFQRLSEALDLQAGVLLIERRRESLRTCLPFPIESFLFEEPRRRIWRVVMGK